MGMVTKIKTLYQNSTNLQLFLRYLGIHNWWDGDGILAIVSNEDTREFVEKLKKEYRKTGWIPYHLMFDLKHDGFLIKENKVAFTGTVDDVFTIPNAIGSFRIMYIAGDDGNNYMWKTYSEKDIPFGKVKCTGRVVCKLNDGNKIINLLSHVRLTEVK